MCRRGSRPTRLPQPSRPQSRRLRLHPKPTRPKPTTNRTGNRPSRLRTPKCSASRLHRRHRRHPQPCHARAAPSRQQPPPEQSTNRHMTHTPPAVHTNHPAPHRSKLQVMQLRTRMPTLLRIQPQQRRLWPLTLSSQQLQGRIRSGSASTTGSGNGSERPIESGNGSESCGPPVSAIMSGNGTGSESGTGRIGSGTGEVAAAAAGARAAAARGAAWSGRRRTRTPRGGGPAGAGAGSARGELRVRV